MRFTGLALGAVAALVFSAGAEPCSTAAEPFND